DLGDRESGIRDGLRGRAGGHDLDARLGHGGREFDEAGLVAHRDEGAADGDGIALAVEGRVGRGSAHGRASSFRSRPPFATSRITRSSSLRATGLMRSWSSASVSPGSTGTRSCTMIGPESTPLSTMITLAPVSVTPASRASRTACAPGNSGRYAGC